MIKKERNEGGIKGSKRNKGVVKETKESKEKRRWK
jgi:hypothetical protein